MTEYDNPEKTSIFSIYINLDSSTISTKEKSGDLEEEYKKKVKYSQLRSCVIQWYSGDVEAYIV